MTCKDCLYHERCHSEIAYGMGSDDLTGEYFTDIEKRCAGFKNKADVVEVKHGYWKEPNGGGYQCTVCRSFFDNYYGFDAKDRCFYCPTCGAKMDVKEGAEG